MVERANSAAPRTRQPAVDDLKSVLVAWVIGGHAPLGCSAVGGWPYDEVRETTLSPHVELGLLAADTDLVHRVPSALARRATRIIAAALATIATFGLAFAPRGGMPDVGPFLGGPQWQALALAAAEAVLVVCGSAALLVAAQRLPVRHGTLARSTRRAAFAAYVLQGPVLVTAAVALRPLEVPVEVKALLVAGTGIVASFGLGHLLVTRTPLRHVLGG